MQRIRRKEIAKYADTGLLTNNIQLNNGVKMRKSINILVLIFTSALLWFLNKEYQYVYLQKALHTFITLSIIYLIFTIFEKLVIKSIKDSKARYSFKKAISTLYLVASIIVIISVWVENTQTLLVTYGLVAAGVAISLQDFFRNFVGGVILFTTGAYRVGDRIEISTIHGPKYGDVIDIGVLYTTLMELKEWVAGDQATGRLSVIPNGYVLSSAVNNYTKDHNFIWDEITIPIKYGSKWQDAVNIILDIVKKETAEITDHAEKEISKLEEKYYLPKKVIEPAIFLRLTDNWIDFNIRYVTKARERRFLNTRLTRLILDEIEKSKKIEIASETLEVMGSTNTKLKKKEKPDHKK